MTHSSKAEDIPEFVPQNLNGHCFHKVAIYPDNGIPETRWMKFWKCCYCGHTFIAEYKHTKLPVEKGHGPHMPVEDDPDHEEWQFEASLTAMTLGYTCETYKKAALSG